MSPGSSTAAEPSTGPTGAAIDLGRQAERTALAWRRTSLTLAAGALVALRVLPHYWGAWGLIVGAAGILVAAAILATTVRRYRDHQHFLTGPSAAGDPPGSAPLALLATAGSATGVCGLLLVIVLIITG